MDGLEVKWEETIIYTWNGLTMDVEGIFQESSEKEVFDYEKWRTMSHTHVHIYTYTHACVYNMLHGSQSPLTNQPGPPGNPVRKTERGRSSHFKKRKLRSKVVCYWPDD